MLRIIMSTLYFVAALVSAWKGDRTVGGLFLICVILEVGIGQILDELKKINAKRNP